MNSIRFWWWLLLLSMITPAYAQPADLPLVLDVVYAQVELQRENTDQWQSLQPGATMPTGTGDRLRTDENGRALLTFPAIDATILILPNTEFVITAAATGPTFAANVVDGDVIHRTAHPNASQTYIISGRQTRVQVASAPAHLLVSQRQGADTVLVHTGAVTLAATTGTLTLTDSEAFYANATQTTIYDDLQAPVSPAAVVGRVNGCAGNIRTETGRNLNARIGPGIRNLQLGQFPDGAAVQVMGVVAAGGWYRVQFRSGFGWVERLALSITDPGCDIPTLPNTAFDLPSTIFDVTAREQTLLSPFYGTPTDDPIFYQPAP